MRLTLAPTTGRFATFAALIGWLTTTTAATVQERPSVIAASKTDLLAMTPQWKGDRLPDGRPKVSDDLLKRMRNISTVDAWELLRKYGYDNQFEGGWKMLNPDDVFVGRIRRDYSCPAGIALWLACDNLRKGAATNSVQIAEEMIARNLV